NVDEAFGRTEPDEEIQDLLRASEGLNLALHYLSGSVTYDPLINKVDAELASKIVWLDALIMNVDRTPRNTNMLMWHKELWLIDHGAAFYFHHSWQDLDNQYKKPFPQIKDHVLLPFATKLMEVDAEMKEIFDLGKIKDIVQLVPDEWLQDEYSDLNESQRRNVYIRFLEERIANSYLFVNEAENAREALI
ncbi:MAG: aminotransferase class I and II, partial [Sphingobacteriales bacterium]